MIDYVNVIKVYFLQFETAQVVPKSF